VLPWFAWVLADEGHDDGGLALIAADLWTYMATSLHPGRCMRSWAGVDAHAGVTGLVTMAGPVASRRPSDCGHMGQTNSRTFRSRNNAFVSSPLAGLIAVIDFASRLD